jgi:hypothetical protein
MGVDIISILIRCHPVSCSRKTVFLKIDTTLLKRFYCNGNMGEGGLIYKYKYMTCKCEAEDCVDYTIWLLYQDFTSTQLNLPFEPYVHVHVEKLWCGGLKKIIQFSITWEKFAISIWFVIRGSVSYYNVVFSGYPWNTLFGDSFFLEWDRWLKFGTHS